MTNQATLKAHLSYTSFLYSPSLFHHSDSQNTFWWVYAVSVNVLSEVRQVTIYIYIYIYIQAQICQVKCSIWPTLHLNHCLTLPTLMDCDAEGKCSKRTAALPAQTKLKFCIDGRWWDKWKPTEKSLQTCLSSLVEQTPTQTQSGATLWRSRKFVLIQKVETVCECSQFGRLVVISY